MKKLLFAAALLVASYTMAQQAITYTEFTYISRGLIDDLQKGKDVKQGYKFIKFEAAQSTESKGLLDTKEYLPVKCYRTNEAAPFALAYYVYVNGNISKVLCIPNNASDGKIIFNAQSDFEREFAPATDKKFLFLWRSLIYIANTTKQ